MIELRYEPADLGLVRFGRSPMQELVNSVRMLGDQKRRGMHGRWLAAARPRLATLDLDLLHALLGQPRYLPDFLFPPPARMDTEFAEELVRVRATPAATIRAELDTLGGDKPLAPVLQPLYERTARGLGELADVLDAYWRAVIEPVWPRLRALLDADMSYRAQQMTTGGVARLLSGLHHDLEYTDRALRVRWPTWNHSTHLRGRGLLLVPCVFAAPHLFVLFNDAYQPMLTYPPRGVAEVWAALPDTADAPVAELLGRSRAALLAQLDLPLTTTQLALNVGLTPGAVSQHLSVLRRSGLVSSRRSGRLVLYQRTPLASLLLGAS